MVQTPRFHSPNPRDRTTPARRHPPRPDTTTWPTLARRLTTLATQLHTTTSELPHGDPDPDPDTLKALRRALSTISHHAGQLKKQL